jgi:hypothetical protein
MPRIVLVVNRERRLVEIALAELAGVGDATLGEWREMGDTALHVRRRLTAVEAALAGIDAVIDVRGTEEFTRRIQQLRPFLPAPMRALPDEAFP